MIHIIPCANMIYWKYWMEKKLIYKIKINFDKEKKMLQHYKNLNEIESDIINIKYTINNNLGTNDENIQS